MNGLNVDHLTVTYAGHPPVVAVDDASLAVAPGEILGLLGPSGSGKSSLLGAIVGTVETTRGTIAWDGLDVTHTPVHGRRFGLVFQDGQLFPHRDVAGNIAFGLEMARVPRAERLARVRALLELIGLEGHGARAVTELSGGERQRVALARSLAPRPVLLCLDEPLSSLDGDLRGRLGADVRILLQASGTTGIVVTHDAAEADLMCDRVIHMRDGRVS